MLINIQPDFPMFPLELPPQDWPSNHFRQPFTCVSKGLRLASRIVTGVPFFFYEVWTVYRLVRRLAPDIVHLNNGGFPAARSVRAAAVGARLAGCKSIIMVVNNLAVPYRSISRRLDYLLDRWVVRSTTTFVTGSIAASERLTSVLQLDPRQVKAIPNGIQLREVSEKSREVRVRLGLPGEFSGLVVGVVALMVERKGHLVLIQALGILKRSIPNLADKLVVWFEGEGEMRKQLELEVEKSDLSDVVLFVGRENRVVDFMNACDALVLPSTGDEDFPNVTVEAMALGKAVIASALAGIPEQVTDGVTGYLVEPGSPSALASAISALMDDPVLVNTMGESGRKRFEEKFTAKIAVARYLDLYRSMARQES